MAPKELEETIRALLLRSMTDAELREHLEQLAVAEISFSGFTWLFGPELYRRNRVLFRPFILSRFSTFMMLPKWRVKAVRWKGDKARALEAWLEEADNNDDADLFRRLYEWKSGEEFGCKHDARAGDRRRLAIAFSVREDARPEADRSAKVRPLVSIG